MNGELIDLYSAYLLSSFGTITATSLSHLLDGSLIHDQITRFLSQQRFDSKTLWQLVKPMVCATTQAGHIPDREAPLAEKIK